MEQDVWSECQPSIVVNHNMQVERHVHRHVTIMLIYGPVDRLRHHILLNHYSM